MEINSKRKVALELLATAGVRRSSSQPPFIRFIWWIGIDLPPPHFASFFINTICSGIYFAVLWGVFMWFAIWSRQDMPIGKALLTTMISGLLFGISMACYYCYGKRKHKLPSWNSLAIDVSHD